MGGYLFKAKQTSTHVIMVEPIEKKREITLDPIEIKTPETTTEMTPEAATVYRVSMNESSTLFFPTISSSRNDMVDEKKEESSKEETKSIESPQILEEQEPKEQEPNEQEPKEQKPKEQEPKEQEPKEQEPEEEQHPNGVPSEKQSKRKKKHYYKKK